MDLCVAVTPGAIKVQGSQQLENEARKEQVEVYVRSAPGMSSNYRLYPTLQIIQYLSLFSNVHFVQWEKG